MAGAISKNARREGEKILTSIAYCVKTGNTARKPKDLM